MVLVHADQHQRAGEPEPQGDRANAPQLDETPKASAPLPGEQNASVVFALEDHGYSTSSFICKSGIKIDMAMNPTAPPRATIMIGSSKLVSATTRVSTSAS